MESICSSFATTSLQLVPLKPSSNCQICDKPAHGYHHGAITCRACCMFFRRSAGFPHFWKCKRQNNNCDIYKTGPPCKQCRLEKCFKIGMSMEKFQYGRDTISHKIIQSMAEVQVPTSLEKFVGRPHIVIRCESKAQKSKWTLVNLTGLIEKGSNILTEKPNSKPCPEIGNSLQKLAFHMENMKKVNAHGNVVYKKMGQKESMLFWELDFCRTAEWLAHFDEFQKLPVSLKVVFLKTIWNLWALVDKLVMTAERYSKLDYPNIVAVDNSASIDTKKLKVDLSWCTDYELDKIRYFIDIHQECSLLKEAVDVLIDLKLTDVEHNFLILQTCFGYAGRRHQGEILDISEKLLGTVSNQMHDYYSNVLKMSHYAGRIAKIMKCDRIIQRFITLRKQKIDIARTFDIFNIQYSHPDMFVDAGY